MGMPAIMQEWTVEMLDALPDDGQRYEIIDGVLFVTPGPGEMHQDVVGELYGLLKVLRQHFPLRKRPKPLFKDRPCMNYGLGLCSGPCQELITQPQYQAIVDQVVLVLKQLD